MLQLIHQFLFIELHCMCIKRKLTWLQKKLKIFFNLQKKLSKLVSFGKVPTVGPNYSVRPFSWWVHFPLCDKNCL